MENNKDSRNNDRGDRSRNQGGDRGRKFSGKNTGPRRISDRDNRGPRREYSDRDNRGPRREYGDRDNRGPRREYGDRDNRGPRREYGDRDNRGPRREYGDRDNRGPRREYGDRDNRGPRREYGDRDNRGPRREYGDRDNRGPRREYGDRDNRGPRREYGDRDNRGPRREYGDRDNRGPRREYGDRDNRGPRRDDSFRARQQGEPQDGYKESTHLDDEGYRTGVSATGMFVKPRYNKKFAVNQDKLTDPNEMSDAGRAAVEAEIREDRLEGRNPIKEALAAGRTIDKLWVMKPKDGRFDPIVAELIREVKDIGGIIMEVDKQALDRLSLTNAHQGVIAQAAVQAYVEVDDILARAKEKGEDPLVLVLDEIQDAYNLGSVFRIADALGAHGVIIPKRRSVGLDAIVAKASAGAIEHVPCARVTNLVQTMKDLKDKGLWIAGTALEDSSPVGDTDLSGPLAVVIGSEGEGMRELVKENCDYVVSIPMKGKINSLNAAVATGIVIYEITRQRGTK